MQNILHNQDILNAYSVIFGPVVGISIDAIMGIPPVKLKTAYRKKAFETHPDRFLIVGKMKKEMNEQFIELNLAYETLQTALNKFSPLVKKNNNSTKKEEHKKKSSTASTCKNTADHFYRGLLPKRKLLIGQFLYYSGIVSWKTLIDALTRQKMQRPPVGQIALKWGILSRNDIHAILKQRAIEREFEKRFVEYAYLKGYLTSFQRLALLGKQRSLQRPIGEFFVEKGILMSKDVELLVKKLQLHNHKAAIKII
ncbi:MAG: J domain-containing protein [Proteobacteria bacterium]|nr:J domain-containing protein [Pseudomonadota bacterium]